MCPKTCIFEDVGDLSAECSVEKGNASIHFTTKRMEQVVVLVTNSAGEGSVTTLWWTVDAVAKP